MTVATQLSTPNPERTRIGESGYRTWRQQVETTGGCTHPVHMSGRWAIQDKASKKYLTSRRGQVMVPCGNRRESVCPACSDRYAADAFHLLRAGLSGDETKHIPASVSEKPRLFVTLTAPSFGAVHNRRTSRNGKIMPCACGEYHHEADPRLGQPLDPETYDYTGHVLWQAHAGQLWDRFTGLLRRHLGKAAGITTRDFRNQARVSFAKVAEYQRRGLIHFHAVVRLDGPEGPADPTPAWGSTEILTDAVHTAHADTRLSGPEIHGTRHSFTWGTQIDVRPIRAANASQVENEHGVITDDRLASYVAKYATKGTGKTEATDRPIRSDAQIDQLDINPHHRRIIHTAWHLGAPVPCPACHPEGEHHSEGCGCTQIQYCPTCHNGGLVTRTTARNYHHPELAETPEPIDRLNLRRWAHMLGFRGHFLSKSKAYSVPFQNIRGARKQYRHEKALADLGIDDESTITVINHWAMTSVGHHTDEQRELAQAIAHRQRETRKHRPRKETP